MVNRIYREKKNIKLKSKMKFRPILTSLHKVHWMSFDNVVFDLTLSPFILQIVHIQIVATAKKE